MVSPSPQAAALAGEGITRNTQILASAIGSESAAFVLADPRWGPNLDLVLARRVDGGWEECGSGSGRTRWSLTDETTNLGVLICWGDAEPEATRLVVTFRGETLHAPVTNGLYLWMVEDVPETALDDPAEYTWLR